MAKRERSIATQLIDANRWRVHPQEAQQRLQERDQRIAADTRTDAERFLGDPPRERSALMQGQQGLQPRRGKSWRTDLWKR
jgi:hypothetical protein